LVSVLGAKLAQRKPPLSQLVLPQQPYPHIKSSVNQAISNKSPVVVFNFLIRLL